MRRLNIFVLLFCISFSLKSDDEMKDFYIDIVNQAPIIFCEDEKTLKYIGMNAKECGSYIGEISTRCNTSLKEVLPKFSSFEHAIRENEKVQYFIFLYISCLKTEIYESKIKNKILSD